MLRFIQTLAFFLFTLAYLSAQATTGRVVDEDGRAIPYATILVAHNGTGTLTDNAGLFQLEGAQLADTTTLTISSIGYETQRVSLEALSIKAGGAVVVLPSANYVLQTAEVAADRIKMKRKKIGMPGIMNGTYIYGTENKIRRHEIGTVLRPDQAAKLDEVIIKVRGMDADSVLLDVNLYRMQFGMVGEPLLKERVFLQLSQAEVGKDISIDLADQGIEVEEEFLVTLRILDVVGAFTEFRIAGKTGEAIGRSRATGGRWVADYMAPNIRVRVRYPKGGGDVEGL
ncbi:carboxypeptidase-like regulatory domain-containing protein [Lewinella sp. 4G2]|uniref:carboxypeptidase-like regulatory domain-containing protein n=1 Tax=Lewinella sp. 4G2 TaxID=1803372 RepID=UPI0007B494B0|nr:carboxypeptidase-like regulatory domain-containing protein [Lewinella sp. 4G2]OAV43641.1 hypothetical protein A3850_003630 [Lewinella sp. 4G2]